MNFPQDGTVVHVMTSQTIRTAPTRSSGKALLVKERHFLSPLLTGFRGGTTTAIFFFLKAGGRVSRERYPNHPRATSGAALPTRDTHFDACPGRHFSREPSLWSFLLNWVLLRSPVRELLKLFSSVRFVHPIAFLPAGSVRTEVPANTKGHAGWNRVAAARLVCIPRGTPMMVAGRKDSRSLSMQERASAAVSSLSPSRYGGFCSQRLSLLSRRGRPLCNATITIYKYIILPHVFLFYNMYYDIRSSLRGPKLILLPFLLTAGFCKWPHRGCLPGIWSSLSLVPNTASALPTLAST